MHDQSWRISQNFDGDYLQGWFQVCAQAMRDGVTLQRLLSLAGRKPGSHGSDKSFLNDWNNAMQTLTVCIIIGLTISMCIWLIQMPFSGNVANQNCSLKAALPLAKKLGSVSSHFGIMGPVKQNGQITIISKPATFFMFVSELLWHAAVLVLKSCDSIFELLPSE